MVPPALPHTFAALHPRLLRHLHEQELQLQDLRARVEHLKGRALEEFELTLELKTYPEEEFVDFAALREEIPALRDKIKYTNKPTTTGGNPIPV